MQPRMLQSKEGSKLAAAAAKVKAASYYKSMGMEAPDLPEDSDDHDSDAGKPMRDYTELFPEIKSEADAPFEKSQKRLYFEEPKICKALVDKHKDNYTRMAQDIKVNYLQWSKGQCRQKVTIYLNSLEKK